MINYAVAKVFITDDEDLIVSGNSELVDKYIDDLYESNCLIKKDIKFDKNEYEHKCEYCELLMSKGNMEEYPVRVSSHEVNLSQEDCDDILNDYRKDMPWAEVINLF